MHRPTVTAGAQRQGAWASAVELAKQRQGPGRTGGSNTCGKVRRYEGAGCMFRSFQKFRVGAAWPVRVEVP